MTNNKEQTAVKLYTEEQVIKMIEKSRETGLTAEFLILTTFPIELPSDEEIEDASLEENNDDLSPAEEFQSGAKWMRNKIQGGAEQ
jgi:hypothetical protein